MEGIKIRNEMLLLIFVCEEAVTLPYYKLGIRSIISILVLLLIGGLRSDNRQRDDNSKQKLQLINELSAGVSNVTQPVP